MANRIDIDREKLYNKYKIFGELVCLELSFFAPKKMILAEKINKKQAAESRFGCVSIKGNGLVYSIWLGENWMGNG